MTEVWGIARAQSVALLGMEAMQVTVEAWNGSGLPRTTMVGLPDAALTQAKERCRAAVLSSGYTWPSHVLTINLTPASLPKTGSHYDLGIAAAVMATEGVLHYVCLNEVLLLGELGLDGQVHPVRGVLPALLGARRLGMTRAVVPAAQLNEARLVEGIEIRGVGDLQDLVAVLNGSPGVETEETDKIVPAPLQAPDLKDVVGLTQAKYALEVAAAGRHHLYFHGPPGVGKALLASCLPTILPDLKTDEAMEVAAIQSLVNLSLDSLPKRPPYSAPHHSASLASLVGGGARIARPGAVSLAHRGVLFLDEAPEFATPALEALRTPLELGEIVLGRSEMSVKYPARFQLVLAANPCPCGLASTPRSKCVCTPMMVRKYASRLSGPITDRIDIQGHILPVRRSLVSAVSEAESSSVVAQRVLVARDRQQTRLEGTPWTTNAELPGRYVRKELPVPESVSMLDAAVANGSLSA
ncbi:MAG: YifB family Mg chelatase-like AAA ATPase, partial [Propionibacteriaceae bacterium]|nr:YifB family Mg chelatase-like AAA ATPase [Propionibacteriaceae bacterium]